ncbi:putative pilus assembly protein FilE [Agitococcus lubricus]|uniref:FilE C-terminal domain-containing protein n=1 Tax=Agitococcus lubricus TaxID=1077255 RepID=A0A2T5IZW0_9GAMM|nr:putative pilus assembly protein FilE [Agitococcus lubricus]PTQ89582.1 hypothetical protein C8N29_106113 [Agitococcus lubricus]
MRFILILLFLPVTIQAEDRFYPTVDAQGRVQIIKNNQSSTSKKLEDSPSDAAKSGVNSENTSLTNSSKPVLELDNEIYIESEVLEKRQFAPEGKKRFYYLPDGSVGSRVIESDNGVTSIVAPPVISTPLKETFRAPTYQIVDKQIIQSWYQLPSECFDLTYLNQRQKPFLEKNSIWIKPPLVGEHISTPEKVLLVSEQLSKMTIDTRFASFATTHKRPKFYVPFIMFADKQGCVLSGVWNYWSQASPATNSQYASVDGLVQLPENTTYVLFYRPVNELKTTLPVMYKTGAFTMDVYSKRLP